MTLSWDTSNTATGYNLYWATTAPVTPQNGTKVTVANNLYTQSGLTDGRIYYYVVTASNTAGESAPSTAQSATPYFFTPAAPTGLTAAAGNTQVTLTWNATSYATGYNLYWSTSSNVTPQNGTKIAGATSPYPHTGLTNGVTYYYVITATNDNGVIESSPSPQVSTTPNSPAPGAPTGLAAAAGNAQITLTWNAVGGATGYNLYWSTSSNVTPQNGTKIAGVTSPYTQTGLTNGTTYYYVVTAVNGGGESAASLSANATPQVPQTWTTKTPMPVARMNAAVGVINGQVYVAGGCTTTAGLCSGGLLNTMVSYNPGTDIWTPQPSMPTARTDLVSGPVVNGMMYVIGGAAPTGAGSVLSNNEAFDSTGGTWSTKASMPTARYDADAVAVNGIVYVIGGDNNCCVNNGVLNTVEAYDPGSNTWSTKASMPTARYGLGVTAVNGIIYAIGGITGPTAAATNVVEAYDPGSNTWSTKASMPTARGFLAVNTVNGIIYAIGGYDLTSNFGTVEAYDPVANTWTTKTPMPTVRRELGSAAVTGVVYAIGGDNGPTIFNTNEAFAP